MNLIKYGLLLSWLLCFVAYAAPGLNGPDGFGSRSGGIGWNSGGSSTLGSWTCTAFCAEDVWALNTIGSVVWKVTERGKSVGIAVGQLKRTCKGINSTYSIYYIVRQCMGCIVTAYIVDSVSASDKWYAESECYFKLNSSASGKIQEYEVR